MARPLELWYETPGGRVRLARRGPGVGFMFDHGAQLGPAHRSEEDAVAYADQSGWRLVAENPAKTFGAKVALVPLVSTSAVTLILIDPTAERPSDEDVVLGYLWATAPERGNVYAVAQAGAVHGYGPLLYASAMEYLKRRRKWLSPGDDVSPEAEAVWARFSTRKDVVSNKLQPHADLPRRAEFLDRKYRLRGPLPGYDDAVERGNEAINRWARQIGLWQNEVATLLLEAGDAYFRHQVRHPAKDELLQL